MATVRKHGHQGAISMQVPKLLLRKGIITSQGQRRPAIQILASVDPAVKTRLEESFLTENLFKRSVYAQGLPEGTPAPTPTLAPHISALFRNDACPEITVKTILNGQLFQAQSLWEVKAFEYAACRAFDALVDLMATVVELNREVSYEPEAARQLVDAVAFAADCAAEAAAARAAADAATAAAPPVANAA
ncbi:MAG: hypothetical protein JNM89_14080 [Hyphomicrobiaceae bacterium]|nr:hypothetical protein [Hyphomicrobiaceae bacterium]